MTTQQDLRALLKSSSASSSKPSAPLSSYQPSPSAQKADEGMARIQVLKNEIHKELIKKIDISAMEELDEAQLKKRLADFVSESLVERKLALQDTHKRQLISAIQNEVMGLGPLEPLLADPTISDILVNGPDTIFVERKGKLELTDVKFNSNEHLQRIIDKIVSRVGRRIDESSPMVDARLPDGSRVNAIISPLALDGAACRSGVFRLTR